MLRCLSFFLVSTAICFISRLAICGAYIRVFLLGTRYRGEQVLSTQESLLFRPELRIFISLRAFNKPVLQALFPYSNRIAYSCHGSTILGNDAKICHRVMYHKGFIESCITKVSSPPETDRRENILLVGSRL